MQKTHSRSPSVRAGANVPRTKSLIVALAEADAGPWTKRLAHVGSEIEGALQLQWMRGYQAGYERCLADGKRRSQARALRPPRPPRG
jgi:hypothetical protein